MAIYFHNLLEGGIKGKNFPLLLSSILFLLSIMIISIVITFMFELNLRKGFIQKKTIKEKKEKLEESEEKYRTLVETIIEGISKVDKNETFVYVNQAAADIFGYPIDEMIGKNMRELTTQEMFQQILKETSLRKKGKSNHYELTVLRKNGEQRIITVTSTPNISENGEYQGAFGIFHDITERKKAVEELKSSRENFHNIVEKNASGVVIIDKEGIVRFVNPSTEEFFNRKAEDLLGKLFDFPLGKGKLLEINIFRKGRTMGTGEMHITESEWEGEFAKLIMINDITDRKQLEEELQKSEEHLRKIIEKNADAIVIVDQKGIICFTNPAAELLFGYKKSKIIGKEFGFPLLTGKKADIKIVTDPRNPKVAEMHLVEIEWEGEKAQLVSIRDITERNQMQEALHKSEEQLRQSQKMEAVGRLAGGMAHDFNNLLTAILGYSELLLNKLGDLNPFSKYPKEIKKAAERASMLTSQLLTFSRKKVLKLKTLDLNVIVTDLEKMLHRLIGEDIELVTTLSTTLGQIKADTGQINQVIMNLVVNARDVMPKGGKISIETLNIDLDEDYARQHAEVPAGPYVMLTVSDTGCGMDKETQSHIFEPFFTTKEVGKGTGLGLSTVYSIVKQGGGSIHVYSEPGKGTTFKILLPRIDETIESHKHGKAPVEMPLASETILVVDDEQMIRDLVCEVLEISGYNVLAAGLGSEAISLCKEYKRPIHLIITDLVMPKMSGRELVKQLKSLRPEMKVLFMSGYTGKEVIDRGILEPGTSFIQKPMSQETLEHKVREVLETPKKK